MSEQNMLAIEEIFNDILSYTEKIFPDDLEQRSHNIKLLVLFFLLYSNSIKLPEVDVLGIYEVLINNSKELSKLNTVIRDPFYIFFYVIAKAHLKFNGSKSLISLIDIFLVKTIDEYRKLPDISYDPEKTPIISQLLTFVTIPFDNLNIEQYIALKEKEKEKIIEKM